MPDVRPMARRWPWALAAAAVGAVVGVWVALALRRRGRADLQGGPELQAVIDRSGGAVP